MNNRKDSMGRHRPLKTRMPDAIEEAAKRADEAPERTPAPTPTPIRVAAKGDNITPYEGAQLRAVQRSLKVIEDALDIEFVAFFYEKVNGDSVAVAGHINQRMMGCNCRKCAHTIELVRKMVAEEMRREDGPVQ